MEESNPAGGGGFVCRETQRYMDAKPLDRCQRCQGRKQRWTSGRVWVVSPHEDTCVLDRLAEATLSGEPTSTPTTK